MHPLKVAYIVGPIPQGLLFFSKNMHGHLKNHNNL